MEMPEPKHHRSAVAGTQKRGRAGCGPSQRHRASGSRAWATAPTGDENRCDRRGEQAGPM